MKKLIAIIGLLYAFVACGQSVPGYTGSSGGFLFRDRVAVVGGLTIPAGLTPGLSTLQWTKAGAVFVDTSGSNKGLYVYWDGVWHRMVDSSGLSAYGLNSVLAVDSYSPTISNNVTIGISSNAWTFNAGTFNVNGTTTNLNSTTVNLSSVNLFADGLPSSHNVDDSMVVYRASTEKLGKRPIPNGNPAGNTSDIQLNRGGVFATPSSDSFNYTQSGGLQLKGGLITLATSGSGTIIIKSTTGGGILFGPLAGQNLVDDVTSTDFVGIGPSALANQHAGVRSNIAIGKVALANDTSGGSNVAVGANTDTRSGQFNTLIGHEINQGGTTNGNNSALGYRSQNACTSCHDNTSAGKQSLESITTGTYNTAFGLLAGQAITTGSQNICLGVGAGYQGATLDPTMSNKFSVFSSSGFSGNDLMWGEINNKRLCINCAEGTALTYTLDVRGKLAVQTVDFISSKDTLLYQDPTDGQIKKTKFVGSTSLTPVGTGYDVGITNTGNVKRLLAGYSISLDSATSNSVKITVDTATLAPYIRSTIPGAASATWNLTGNSGVTTSQFLGTTDATKVRIRTNNTERGYWDSTGTTLFIGAPTYVNNTYGLIIQSPTNNTSQAIKVYYNNLSGSAELGAGRLLFSGSADIAWSSGTGKINSPNGLKIGDANTPTAFLHIVPGTASAGKGQIKLSEGVKLTTAENGVITFDTTSSVRTLLFDVGTTHYTIARTLTGSATLDFTSTAALSTSDLTITVTGAADGDEVDLGVPNGSEPAGSNLYGWRAWVSSANTVTVRLLNFNAVTAIDPASGTFRVTVIKH